MCMSFIQWLPKSHHTRCKDPIPIPNASRRRVVSSELPDTHRIIRTLHAESGKKTVPLCSVLSFDAPQSPSLTMLRCQGKLK
ncbi:hypothetical protein TNCV_4146741 [Trichonephila clavipes]|nr:hypothetical protein TNCV_4146741 [Trichonephila clavipes]